MRALIFLLFLLFFFSKDALSGVYLPSEKIEEGIQVLK